MEWGTRRGKWANTHNLSMKKRNFVKMLMYENNRIAVRKVTMLSFARISQICLLLTTLLAQISGEDGKKPKILELSHEELKVYTNGHPFDDYDVTEPTYQQLDPTINKRSVDSKPVDADDLSVTFNAFGETYHAHLKRNYWLLRQGLVVEWVDANGGITEEYIDPRDCYYHGNLVSHGPSEDSVSALSTCNGLRGQISYGDTDVFIAPLKDHHASRVRRDTLPGKERPHFVYKRTARKPRDTTSSSSTSSSDYDYGYDEDDNSTSYFDWNMEGEHAINDSVYFCSEAYAHTHNSNAEVNSTKSYQPDASSSEVSYSNQLESMQSSSEFDQSSSFAQSSAENTDQSGATVQAYGANGNLSGLLVADMAAEQDEGEHEQEEGDRFVEMFVIIDSTMVDFHQDDVINYTLTLMNIMSRRYAEPTLRAQIRIAIVRIVVAVDKQATVANANGKPKTLSIHGDGPAMLEELCEWQKKINPVHDSDPQHWDLAIMITRQDLYKRVNGKKDFGLLGRAYVGTVCDRKSSCSINQEDGLETGLVMAHETGHNLNLRHDPDYGCPNGRHVMSSMRTTGPASFRWSRCSADNLADFLESPRSACMMDRPATDDPNVDIVATDVLPGVIYGRLAQCQKAYGAQVSQLCGNRQQQTCGKLGCIKGRTCKFTQVMQGTTCGVDKWCYDGFCISNIGGLPDPIHGEWGEWTGEYRQCSKTCGTGLKFRKRNCNQPSPRYGGMACPGPMYIMETCNTEPCADVLTADDFRAAECWASNVRGHKFLPNLDGDLLGDHLCQLQCLISGQMMIRPPKTVSHGTLCWDEEEPDEIRRERRCVQGKCKEIGCDGIYHSGKIVDVCGKCEGSGRTCIHRSGTLTQKLPRIRAHWTWLNIPVGAFGLNITNTNNYYCTLGASAGDVRLFRPNGGVRVRSTRYTVGSDLILHRIDSWDWETIRVVSGATTNRINIVAFQEKHPGYYGNKVNPRFTYEYYEPISEPITYYWESVPYTECSATCGGGNTTATITCYEEIGGERVIISHRFCNETTKPSIYPACNTQFCPGLMWLISEWGDCSVSCEEGNSTRDVDCIEGSTLERQPTIDCVITLGYRPNYTRPCNEGPCPTTGPTTVPPTEQTTMATTRLQSTQITLATTRAMTPTLEATTTAGATNPLSTIAASAATNMTTGIATNATNATYTATSGGNGTTVESTEENPDPLISIPDCACVVPPKHLVFVLSLLVWMIMLI